MDMVCDATAQLCEDELAPLTMTSDRNGCVWVDENTIKTPKGFKEAYALYKDAGWQGLSYPEEWGGQNLPMSMALLQAEMVSTPRARLGLFKAQCRTRKTQRRSIRVAPPLPSPHAQPQLCLRSASVIGALLSLSSFRWRRPTSSSPCFPA
jgi:hypothetical protein